MTDSIETPIEETTATNEGMPETVGKSISTDAVVSEEAQILSDAASIESANENNIPQEEPAATPVTTAEALNVNFGENVD